MIRALRRLLARLVGLPPCPTCGRAAVAADKDGFLLCAACVFGRIVKPPASVEHPMWAARRAMPASMQGMVPSERLGSGVRETGMSVSDADADGFMRRWWPDVTPPEDEDEESTE